MASDAAIIVDSAIDWHLRQREMGDADWRAFVEWLEADPAHARAFDAVALDLALLSDRADLFPAAAAPSPRLPVVPAPARRVRRWAAGGIAVAAAASLAFVVAPTLTAGLSGVGGDPYTVQTKPGQRRDIALADGTRIELNGATRLRLDHADPRVATLETGEATFHVRHDPRDPFTVRSGGLVVQDMGTVFNVERDGARLDVQVAEGSVLFQPKREAVTLRAGAAITAREDRGSVTVGRIDVAKIGAWRSGSLVFTGEPFGRLAASLLRLEGVRLSIDPALSRRPFTGMVRLAGTAERDIPHIAALVGAESRKDGERWIISPR